MSTAPELRSLAEIERDTILARLRYFNGDKVKAAKSLGISLKTIYNRLNHYAAVDAAARMAA